jgi:hypothetical protein
MSSLYIALKLILCLHLLCAKLSQHRQRTLGLKPRKVLQSSNFHSHAPPWLRLSVFCPTVHPLQTTDHKSEGSMRYGSTSFGTAEACTKNTKQIYTSQREKQNFFFSSAWRLKGRLTANSGAGLKRKFNISTIQSFKELSFWPSQYWLCFFTSLDNLTTVAGKDRIYVVFAAWSHRNESGKRKRRKLQSKHINHNHYEMYTNRCTSSSLYWRKNRLTSLKIEQHSLVRQFALLCSLLFTFWSTSIRKTDTVTLWCKLWRH